GDIGNRRRPVPLAPEAGDGGPEDVAAGHLALAERARRGRRGHRAAGYQVKIENVLGFLRLLLPSVTMTQTSDADRKIPTRRISFEAALRDLPKHFAADGDLILSHLAASLSAVFPDGEDFFVRSVRHYRDRITD